MEALLDGERASFREDSDEYLFVSEDVHTKTAFSVMNELRGRRCLCDVVLVAGHLEISAHKVVLASASRYFYAMFAGEMVESRIGRVEIKEIVEPEALSLLVDFVYTGQLEINSRNTQALLSAAALLHLEAARQACVDFLMRQLDPANCLGIRSYADLHACEDLVHVCDRFFSDNFVAVVASDEYLSLPGAVLEKLLESDELNVNSEREVYEAVLAWVKHDVDSRQTLLSRLLARVRLAQLPPSYIATKVEREAVVRRDLDCRDLIDEAKNFHLLVDSVTDDASDDYERRQRCRPRKSTIGCLYSVGGRGKSGEPYMTVERYDFRVNQWQPVAELNSRRRHVGVAALDRHIYAVGGHDGEQHLNTVECYDMENNKWEIVEPMVTRRRGVAVGILGGPLYAIGGLNDSACFSTVERYNPQSRQWTEVCPMNSPRGGVGVVTLGGYLYAAGGNNGSSSLGSVERYDPHTNQWTAVQMMNVKRAGVGLAAVEGRLIAVGGFDDSSPLDSVESFDPRTGEWTLISSLNNPRGGVGVASLGGWVFAVGGHDGRNYLNSVEVYDIHRDLWESVACMLTSRAGAGVAGLPAGIVHAL